MLPTGYLVELLRAAASDGGAMPAARRLLAECGLDVVEVPGTRAIVARRGSPRLCFAGHVDVVPTGDGWQRAPGDVADGRVWGRGASDMLGSVACWIALARTTTLPFAVALTTDEETRMGDAEALVASGLLSPYEAIVVGEPTDLEIGVAEKGVLWVRATVAGRAAHASMPAEGINAIEAASRAILRLKDLELPGRHASLGAPTISVDRIAGGAAVNVVPESCTFEVDIRYLPGVPSERIVELVDSTIQRAVDVHKLEVMSHHPPFEARDGSRLVAAAEAAVKAAGRSPRRVGLPYGTEASRYVQLGNDLVILGCGERALAHTNREAIRVEDLEAGLRAYRALAEAYA